MQTQTLERARPKISASAAGAVGYAGAAAFVIAAVWNVLVTKAVTVAPPPQVTPSTPPDQATHMYLRWLLTTFGQERLNTIAAIIGFGCLAATAIYARDMLGRDRALPRAGAAAVTFGAALWVTGAVLQLGGHRAIGLMATHANPAMTVASIGFTIDTIAEAFALAAFAFIGAGLLAYARAASAQDRAWTACTVVLAAFSLAVAVTYSTGNGDLIDWLLLGGGAVLVPTWLIWTSRLAGRLTGRLAGRPA
jgi:hypothetical protein